MKDRSLQDCDRVEHMVYRYGNLLVRLCLVTLGNVNDAEDAVQETFIRYFRKAPVFEHAEHEKAWLITVALNKCRDMLRFRRRHMTVDPEEIRGFSEEVSHSGILDALMTLPEKFRIVLVLYYVEEYSTEEIARVIGRTRSAVKMRLQKGRRLLLEVYRKEYM